MTARYTFVAGFAGTYEFVCTYHFQLAMTGHLVVLPDGANAPSSTTTASSLAGTGVRASMAEGRAWPPTSGSHLRTSR